MNWATFHKWVQAVCHVLMTKLVFITCILFAAGSDWTESAAVASAVFFVLTLVLIFIGPRKTGEEEAP